MKEPNEAIDIDERVTTIVADVFNEDAESITRSTEFVGDLNAKSMDIIALLAALEGEFGFPISAADVRRNETVGEASDWISQELDARDA
ncbi:hypothetical protein JCM30237_24770 [Halolamina litorea]|uniref:Acyl carrier protein n=1 Tax=Halolamina litorea TaxID=1515593 RepID=A0ABD6BUY6_9EURY|nr:phosphopantetheine-binding protein [Halolamina litorea]